jgi:hypothetical protein
MTGTRGSASPAWRCTTLSRTSGRQSATCPLAAAAPGSGYSTAFSTGSVQMVLCFVAVLRIRRIHMFLGLPDPDPLVRGMDPGPSIIKQK